MNEIKTSIGVFHRDPCGLWHYEAMPGNGHFTDHIANAINNKPDAPTWFWYAGVPAPMTQKDTNETLIKRWSLWNNANRNEGTILEELEDFVSGT